MRLLKIILLLALFAGGTTSIHAQKTNKKISKSKLPKLSTLLSTYKDSTVLNSGDVASIVGMPLRVIDDKKNVYPISSYQFLYRKNVMTEDEEGKASASTSILADRFKTSPLSEKWVNKLREELRSGELLYFFDIIVKDAEGRVMYAPDLKIIVQ